jgi:hypothetical protein
MWVIWFWIVYLRNGRPKTWKYMVYYEFYCGITSNKQSKGRGSIAESIPFGVVTSNASLGCCAMWQRMNILLINWEWNNNFSEQSLNIFVLFCYHGVIYSKGSVRVSSFFRAPFPLFKGRSKAIWGDSARGNFCLTWCQNFISCLIEITGKTLTSQRKTRAFWSVIRPGEQGLQLHVAVSCQNTIHAANSTAIMHAIGTSGILTTFICRFSPVRHGAMRHRRWNLQTNLENFHQGACNTLSTLTIAWPKGYVSHHRQLRDSVTSEMKSAKQDRKWKWSEFQLFSQEANMPHLAQMTHNNDERLQREVVQFIEIESRIPFHTVTSMDSIKLFRQMRLSQIPYQVYTHFQGDLYAFFWFLSNQSCWIRYQLYTNSFSYCCYHGFDKTIQENAIISNTISMWKRLIPRWPNETKRNYQPSKLSSNWNVIIFKTSEPDAKRETWDMRDFTFSWIINHLHSLETKSLSYNLWFNLVDVSIVNESSHHRFWMIDIIVIHLYPDCSELQAWHFCRVIMQPRHFGV